MMNTFLLGLFLILNVLDTAELNSSPGKLPLAPKVYSNLLGIRRKEHAVLIDSMLKANYAKNYKMISIAFEKIFQVIEQSNRTLTEDNYTSVEGFPTDQRKQEAVSSLLENTCLISDIILHFPDISYKLLQKTPNWKDTINWCIDFVNEFPSIVDKVIVELMDLARQEINEDLRSPEFQNPYREIKDTISGDAKKMSKPRKKIKKGPQLTRNEL